MRTYENVILQNRIFIFKPKNYVNAFLKEIIVHWIAIMLNLVIYVVKIAVLMILLHAITDILNLIPCYI